MTDINNEPMTLNVIIEINAPIYITLPIVKKADGLIVMLCYASRETIHDVTKNFYQCTATHFGMIYFYNER